MRPVPAARRAQEPDCEGAARALCEGPLPCIPRDEPFLECLWALPALEALSERAGGAARDLAGARNPGVLHRFTIQLIQRPYLSRFQRPQDRALGRDILRLRLLQRLAARLEAAGPGAGPPLSADLRRLVAATQRFFEVC